MFNNIYMPNFSWGSNNYFPSTNHGNPMFYPQQFPFINQQPHNYNYTNQQPNPFGVNKNFNLAQNQILSNNSQYKNSMESIKSDPTAQSFLQTSYLSDILDVQLGIKPSPVQESMPAYASLDQMMSIIPPANNTPTPPNNPTPTAPNKGNLFQTEIISESNGYHTINLDKANNLSNMNDIKLLDNFGINSVNNILFNYKIPALP